MPFSHVAQRVVGHKQVASSDIFDVPVERVIAQSRLTLCLISLFVAYLQPIQPARYAAAATLVLTVYTLFSAGLVVLTYHRFLGLSTQWLIHCPPSALMRQIGWVEEGRISGSS